MFALVPVIAFFLLNKKEERLPHIQDQELRRMDPSRAAIQLRPNDQWLKDMRQRVGSPNAKDDDFHGRLNLGFRFEDLLG